MMNVRTRISNAANETERFSEIVALKSRPTAVLQLGRRLAAGELGLILGAGVSSSLSLPGWKDLVNRCAKAVGDPEPFLKRDRPDGQKLQEEATKIRAKFKAGGDGEAEYHDLLRKMLYKDFDADKINKHSALLNALGYLTLGHAFGRVDRVITFNYDDCLERYLSFRGLHCQEVSRLPSMRSDADTTVIHAHGLLPLVGDAVGPIVFNEESYWRRLGGTDPVDRLWRLEIESQMLTKQWLVIGMSGTFDSAVPIYHDVFQQLHKSPRKYLGYWLFVSSDPIQNIDRAERMGFVPVILPSHKEYESFLYEIRRNAVESY